MVLRRPIETAGVHDWPVLGVPRGRLGNELALVKARRYLDAIDKLMPSAP